MPNLSFDVLWRDRGAERGMRNLGDTTERTGKRFSALKATAAVSLAALAAGAVKFGANSVRAYIEAEGAQGRLQDAYAKFPKLADVNIRSLQKLNEKLALKTKFDDDATASGQAVLAQFRLTGTQISQLTPLLQDYAAKTGKDLPTAAGVLGKAMLGNGRALRAVGINFKDAGSTGANFEQIMAGLRTQVGGFAENEGKRAAGQAEILRNQFGEIQESVGRRALPALVGLGRGLLSVMTYAQDSNSVFGSMKRVVSATFGSFTESLGLGRASFRRFADFLATHQAAITVGFVAVGKIVIEVAKALTTLAAGGLRGAAMLMDGYANLTELMIGSFRAILRGATIAFGWIPGVGDKLRVADARFAAFSDTAVGGMRRAAAGTRGAADSIDNKLRPALDKAGRKLDEVGRKEIVKAETRDAVNKAAIAVRDLGTKTDGSQIKIKRFSDITKLSAAEQRAFRGRLENTRTALQAKIEKMRQAGAGSAEMRREVGRSREALFREFRQMGLSVAEARKLAIRYSQVPKKAETRVTQPGMSTALGDTAALRRYINAIPNTKKVTITFSAKSFVGADGVTYKVNTSAPSSAGRSGPGMVFGSKPLSLDAHGVPQTAGPGPRGGGPDPKRSKIVINTARLPQNARNQPGEIRDMITGYEQGIGKALGKAVVANVGATAPGTPGGRVGTRNVGAGWGPIQAAMRRHGARTFNTYPGHHPSMARARDVYPHNWAAANAARALSSVWYVIYRMKIASKNHGNVWRPYRPTNFRGDWRHVRHIHVARYDKGGMLPPGVSLAVNNTGRAEIARPGGGAPTVIELGPRSIAAIASALTVEIDGRQVARAVRYQGLRGTT